MSKACTMILYWRHQLKIISRDQEEVTVLYQESSSAISTSKANTLTQSTKHIDAKYHY